MVELAISRLNLEIRDAAGHEHRVHGITARAVALIGERMAVLSSSVPTGPPRELDAIAPAPVPLDLTRMDDASCACALADAVMDAIRLRLEV